MISNTKFIIPEICDNNIIETVRVYFNFLYTYTIKDLETMNLKDNKKWYVRRYKDRKWNRK